MEFYGLVGWFCILVWLMFDLYDEIGVKTFVGVATTLGFFTVVALALYAAIVIVFLICVAAATGGREKTMRTTAEPSSTQPSTQRIEVRLYLMSVGNVLGKIFFATVMVVVIKWQLLPAADLLPKSLWATATWWDIVCLVAAPFVFGAWQYACGERTHMRRRAMKASACAA